MAALEDVTQVLTALASLAAVVVAILAFWTYRDLRPKAQLKRRQDEHMSHLAVLVMQVLDRQQVFYAANLHDFEVDPYQFVAASREAKQLGELLDGCTQLQLTRYCVGVDRDHQWALYGALRAAVAEQAELDPSLATPDDYTKQHFVMGLIRIADLCLEYEGIEMPEDLVESQRRLDEDMHKLAWTYLKQ